MVFVDKRYSSPVREDTEPYERSELGEVGEGLWVIEGTQPLTQLRLGNTLPSLRNPLPLERDSHPNNRSISFSSDSGVTVGA